MPIITIEKKEKVADEIYEITEKTYEIPDKIVVGGRIYDYDGNSKAYVKSGNGSFEYYDAKDYVNAKLKAQEKKNLNNDGRDM